MPKFLHTADWQIGRQYGRFPADDAAALAEARFTAVEKLAQLATDHAVDAVLVAGDIFDAQGVSERTLRRVFMALEAYRGPWLLLPGNHDAAVPESVWHRAQRLGIVPPHVHVLLQPGATEFPQLSLAVLATPLTQRQTVTDVSNVFDTLSSSAGLVRVGLAHGSVTGVLDDDIDSGNPIAADRAERAGLDYLALGDWHGLKSINARTWYSGTPEPDRFKDNGAGQALLVDIPQPGAEPQVTPLAVAQYCWQEWQVTLHVPGDVHALCERLAALPPPAVLALQVRGEINLADEQRLQTAVATAQARHRCVEFDRRGLRLVPTPNDLASLQATGYMGDVIEELRNLQEQADGEVATEALAILAGLLREQQEGSAPCS